MHKLYLLYLMECCSGWSAHAIVTSYRYTDTLQVYRHPTGMQHPKYKSRHPKYKSKHNKICLLGCIWSYRVTLGYSMKKMDPPVIRCKGLV